MLQKRSFKESAVHYNIQNKERRLYSYSRIKNDEEEKYYSNVYSNAYIIYFTLYLALIAFFLSFFCC